MKKSQKQVCASIIGRGLIGMHIASRVKEELGLEPIFSLDPSAKIAFLAISTRDKGEAARDYILECMRLRIPVVTCEKGSLSYHAKELMPHILAGRIGFDAACGGGTRMLSKARALSLRDRRSVEVNAVLNSTLNFIASAIESGKTAEEAYEAAKAGGIVEPGSKSFADMIRGEIQDVIMKTCVFHNTVLLSPRKARARMYLTPECFRPSGLPDEFIEQLIDCFKRGFRMSVSFFTEFNHAYYPCFHSGGFSAHCGACTVKGGFRMIPGEESDFRLWFPQGIENGIWVTEGRHKIFELKGPGAKPAPTTDAMLTDARMLIKK